MSVKRISYCFWGMFLIINAFCASADSTVAQEARPFEAQVEQILRDKTSRFRTEQEKRYNPAPLQDSELFRDQITTRPLGEAGNGGRTNSFEEASADQEFAEDPFARFEASSGDPADQEERLLTRKRSEQGREETLLEPEGGDQNNQNSRARRRDQGAEGEERQRLDRRNRFEDEFLAAERQLNDETGLEGQPVPTDQTARRDRRAQNNPASQQGLEYNGQDTLNGARRNLARRDGTLALEADQNDITGSIRPNAPEDPYAQIGKPFGSFLLFSELTLNGVFSDNPTASVNNGPGDEAIELIPHFLLRSDWSRHALEIEGQLRKSYYDELTSENIDEWYISSKGRLDIQRNHYLEVQGRIEEGQDDRGDIDNLNTDTELASFQVMTLTAIYNIEWNRIGLRFTGNLIDYDYDDTANSLGQIINNDDQDYQENNISARLGYTFHPGFYAYLEGHYVNRDFETFVDDQGFQRSNEGETLSLGAIYDISSLLRIEGTIGHEWLQPDDPRYVDIEEVIYSAALTYRLSEKTTLILRTERDVETTDLDGTVGFVETEYSLALTHYFRSHLRLGATLTFEEEEYPGLTIEQERLTTELSLQYIFNRHMRLMASYEFTDTNTNDGGDYRENIFRIGLNLRP